MANCKYYRKIHRKLRFDTAGAIAGPIVEMDVRTLYLKDLTYCGCRVQDQSVVQNLVGYIERGEIRPMVARTYPLRDIVRAQQDFLSKRFAGKLVLIPWLSGSTQLRDAPHWVVRYARMQVFSALSGHC